MIKQIYTILDKVAEEYGDIFLAKNDGIAKRYFNQLINEVDENRKNEYELKMIGIWYPNIGKGEFYSEVVNVE